MKSIPTMGGSLVRNSALHFQQIALEDVILPQHSSCLEAPEAVGRGENIEGVKKLTPLGLSDALRLQSGICAEEEVQKIPVYDSTCDEFPLAKLTHTACHEGSIEVFKVMSSAGLLIYDVLDSEG